VAGCWGEADLREAALVLDGYASEAELDREAASLRTITAEADDAGTAFVAGVADELESLIDRLSLRHTGWLTRWRYEILLAVMLVILIARLGKNFFYDSWLAHRPAEIYGLDVYLLSALWLILWCALLLWGFTSRLRRGLKHEIHELAEGWKTPKPAEGVFARLESHCRRAHRFRHDLEALQGHVATLRRRLGLPDEQLGRRR
jgi:hypothetical protein